MFALVKPRSDRAAAAIAPGEAIGASAATRHHHDGTLHHHRARRDDDRAAVPDAAAIGAAMPARAAATGCVGGADSGECGRHQNCCCKKILHSLSSFFGPRCGTATNIYLPIRPGGSLQKPRPLSPNLVLPAECDMNAARSACVSAPQAKCSINLKHF